MLGPLGFDLRDDLRCKRDRLAATFGDPDQSCAGIGRVGHPLDIAGPLKLIHQEAGGLLGDRAPVQPGRSAGCRRCYALGHPRLRRREVVMAGGSQGA